MIESRLNEILDARSEATALIVHNDASIAALPAVLRGRTFLLPYTAVETSPDRLARAAVQHLIERIGQPEAAPVVRLLAPELTLRQSTAAASPRE